MALAWPFPHVVKRGTTWHFLTGLRVPARSRISARHPAPRSLAFLARLHLRTFRPRLPFPPTIPSSELCNPHGCALCSACCLYCLVCLICPHRQAAETFRQKGTSDAASHHIGHIGAIGGIDGGGKHVAANRIPTIVPGRVPFAVQAFNSHRHDSILGRSRGVAAVDARGTSRKSRSRPGCGRRILTQRASEGPWLLPALAVGMNAAAAEVNAAHA